MIERYTLKRYQKNKKLTKWEIIRFGFHGSTEFIEDSTGKVVKFVNGEKIYKSDNFKKDEK